MNSSFLSPHFGLIPLVLFSSLFVLNQETRKVLFQQPLPIHPGWLTLRSNQKSPINLMFMFLERGRKPEHLEKTHTGMSRTQEGLDRSWTWNILATQKGETLERVSPDLQMTSSRDWPLLCGHHCAHSVSSGITWARQFHTYPSCWLEEAQINPSSGFHPCAVNSRCSTFHKEATWQIIQMTQFYLRMSGWWASIWHVRWICTCSKPAAQLPGAFEIIYGTKSIFDTSLP